jgi:DNA-binding winged helix-turn-helix (wHTH) protein
MRALAGPQAAAAFKAHCGHEGILVHIDCNQAVATSPQAFYEVVLRAVLEPPAGGLPADLMDATRRYHEAVTEAANAFSASLSFNLALTELCEQLDRPLCLLIDEFDELYVGLDERALLNLRALKDRFKERLVCLTATLRQLTALRGDATEDEFAEMFAASTYLMPPLEPEEIDRFLDGMTPPLSPGRRVACRELSGGHPGLLTAIAHVLHALPPTWQGDLAWAAAQEPGPRAECLKIWTQLTADEQADLLSLALEAEAGVPEAHLRRLEGLGLVRYGRPFSPIFLGFVARRGRAATVGSEGVHLDPDSGDVWVDGVRIPVLTDLEFRLLRLLHERRDKLTDKYRIVTVVWGEEYLGEVDDARVEKLVSRLRAQIEPDPSNPRYLITQRGRGYKLLSKPLTP